MSCYSSSGCRQRTIKSSRRRRRELIGRTSRIIQKEQVEGLKQVDEKQIGEVREQMEETGVKKQK